MKDFKIYISIASLLLIGYLVAQYNKPSPLNWNTTFYYKDKIPYGTFILYNQLPIIFPGAAITKTNQSVYEALNNNKQHGSNYLIISKEVSLSKSDYKAMLAYLRAGNSVFISSLVWNGFFTDTLKIETQFEYKKKNIPLNFTNQKLKRTSDYIFENGVSNQYFSSFDTAHAVVLGKNANGKSNFLRYSYGSGSLYLCADPQIFTNVSLLNQETADYAAKALSYLPTVNRVYWDEYQNGDIPEDASPMRVFFSYPALQWAYGISLVTLLIFVLYEKKRRQRIIPIITPLANSTLEFVNVVGQVYYEQRDNRNICHKKILYFLEYLRTNFQLKTNPLNQEFIDSLSKKTGISDELAKEITGYIQYLGVQPCITDHELILLNQLIEKFYKQSA